MRRILVHKVFGRGFGNQFLIVRLIAHVINNDDCEADISDRDAKEKVRAGLKFYIRHWLMNSIMCDV